MANEVEVIVDGVTRLRKGNTNIYQYKFPNGTIIDADDGNESVTYHFTENLPKIQRIVPFDEITDKKGATTPTEYVLALANEKAFFKPSNGGGGVAQDLTYTAPNLSLTGSAVDINVTQFPFLATSLNPALSNIGLDSLGNAAPIPIFNDENDRDAQIPSPVDGQLCYLLNNTIQERYYDVFGLWLNTQMLIAIVSTSVVPKRVVEVEGAFPALNYDGLLKQFPLVQFPTNGSQQDRTLGVTMSIGKAIDGTNTRFYATVRTKGQAYVEFAEAIAAGELVEARIAGGGEVDIGKVNGSPTGSTGSMAIAIADSGSNILEPLAVLVNIGLITETF